MDRQARKEYRELLDLGRQTEKLVMAQLVKHRIAVNAFFRKRKAERGTDMILVLQHGREIPAVVGHIQIDHGEVVIIATNAHTGEKVYHVPAFSPYGRTWKLPEEDQ